MFKSISILINRRNVTKTCSKLAGSSDNNNNGDSSFECLACKSTIK